MEQLSCVDVPRSLRVLFRFFLRKRNALQISVGVAIFLEGLAVNIDERTHTERFFVCKIKADTHSMCDNKSVIFHPYLIFADDSVHVDILFPLLEEQRKEVVTAYIYCASYTR